MPQILPSDPVPTCQRIRGQLTIVHEVLELLNCEQYNAIEIAGQKKTEILQAA